MINANIISEVRKLLALIEQERCMQLAEQNRLTIAILDAVQFDADGRSAADVRVACKSVLDAAYDVLGECEPAELLCALLGYSEDEESEPS